MHEIIVKVKLTKNVERFINLRSLWNLIDRWLTKAIGCHSNYRNITYSEVWKGLEKEKEINFEVKKKINKLISK